MTPMGRTGRFRKYHPDKDALSVTVGGTISMNVKLRQLPAEEMLRIARKLSDGNLPAAGSRAAACYLLVLGKVGETGEIEKLLAAVRAAGQNVADLEERLQMKVRGACEVAAEKAWKGLKQAIPVKLSKRDAGALNNRLKKYLADHGKAKFTAGLKTEIAALGKRIGEALERLPTGALTATWRRLKMQKAPCPREYIDGSMLYDSRRKRCILLGGYCATYQRMNDMWALDVAKSTWTCLAPHRPKADGTSYPRPIRNKPCAYDVANDLYVWGSWTHDPATCKWDKLEPRHRPPARCRHKLIWNSKAGVVVLFGGSKTGRPEGDIADLWVFDPAKRDWLEIKPNAGPKASGGTCYDAAADLVVLFCQDNAETWTLRLTRIE